MTAVADSNASRAADAARDTSDLLLELSNISKRFPGVIALEGVDFDLRRGEVHVLFGENGAGKSTLINIIAGTFPPDTGTFKYQGKEITHLTPHGARVIGISPVFQEFSLVPELTVEQNLFLGREITAGGFLNRPAMRARARAIVRELNFDLRPDYKVSQLSRAHQQMVEIAKAFLTEVRLLILDEPTASLTDAEAAKLFGLIAKLKASGVGIIYVSHRMREIKQIADRITVLRDGHKIKTVEAKDVSETELVELMTGRKIGVLFPTIAHKPADKLLEVEHVTLADRSVNDVSFYARAGEITGIAGLVGCGKSEIVRAIVGLEPMESGTIRVRGKDVAAPTPGAMLKNGVCYFPSDRVAEGLALARPVRENVSMAALDLPGFSHGRILQRRSERRHRAGDRRQTVAAPAAHRARGRVVLRRQSAENSAGARTDTRHLGVSVRRAHGGRRCRRQDRDLRVDEEPVGDRRRDRAGLVRLARSAPLVEPALCHAPVADGGRACRRRHQRAGRACHISSASNMPATGCRAMPREAIRGSTTRAMSS